MCNKLFRKILSLTAAALLCLCCVLLPGVQAFADSTAVEEAQHGVVRVICISEVTSRGYALGLGTGFAVGKLGDEAEIIITNNHVVEDNVNEIYVTITDFDGRQPAEVIYRDINNDIAILRLNRSIPDRHPLPLLSSEELTKSQDVYCLGFPGSMDDFSDRGEDISSTVSDLTITKGTVSNPEYSLGGTACILTDCVINHGNSGGPMVDEYGQVVGINTWGLDENMNCAVSIDYVISVLDRKGIDYVLGSPDGTVSRGKGGGIVYVLCGIAAAAVAVAFFVIKKKGGKVKPVKPVEHAAALKAPDVTVPVKQLCCIVEKGIVIGQRYCGSEPIRIGRDQSCQIIFPQGSPGISKMHCEVSMRGEKIYVRDMGSTYGTFLMDGTKLAPGVMTEIINGSVFCLASQDTVIRVTVI